MSKLKRKKAPAEENKPEPRSVFRDLPESLRNPGGDTSSRSSPSRPWWTAADLSEVEKLWALTLQDLLPAMSSSPAMGYHVPELPETPMKAESEEQCEERWCSLDEDADELPALTDSPDCILIPSPPHFTLNEGNHQPETSTAEQLSEMGGEQQTLSSSQRHLEEDRTLCLGDGAPLQKKTKKPDWLSERKRDGDISMLLKGAQKSGGVESKGRIKPGCHGKKPTPGSHRDKAESIKPQERKLAGGKSERKPGSELYRLGYDKTEAGSSKSRILSTKGLDRGLQASPGSRVSNLENDSECRAGTSKEGTGSGLAEAKLECCPMCLKPFPAGFSQMECDGHLAQCLSEINTDVIW
ncbi:hypothetical protein NFI96_015569 [Prochilodus magdalenae]|nr:hypothetical protein NFI96_015569 [Prochilodus magdalenae]